MDHGHGGGGGGRGLPEACMCWTGLELWGRGGVFMAWFQTLNTDWLCSYTNSEFNHVPAAALNFTGAIN